MRALLVVNPVATTTSAATREVLAAALGAEAKVEVATTGTRGHATELGRQAAEDGLDLVVVLGGDGTVNEVVNGLLVTGPQPDGPALGVVPGGGRNVFARALGLPTDPVEATGALLRGLRERRFRTIGLGRAEERWFTFTAGMGWDAAVVARVDRRRRAATVPPRTVDYVRAAVHEFFLSGQRRRPALTVTRPGAEPLTGVHLAIVANTTPWTYLGHRPLHVCPDAGFDTGLDLYALTSMSTLGTLAEVRRALARPGPRPSSRRPRRSRRSRRSRRAERCHDLAELTLVADRPRPAQVDGESLGDRRRLDLRSVPQALRVVG